LKADSGRSGKHFAAPEVGGESRLARTVG
jgi:hypothetical protein